MRVEKRVLNDALRVLGKVVCQTSPVELYRSVRFVGDGDGVMAMAPGGVPDKSGGTVPFYPVCRRCRWSYGNGYGWRRNRFGDSGCVR